MLGRRRTPAATDRDDVIVEHGPSLAKGPALAVGTILTVFGLAGLLQDATFPSASSNFPDGSATGGTLLGIEVNGWTNWACIAAGALLLFGAAQHHLAKIMSLLVGLALAACAIIGLVDGDVLGLAAANGWTELGWGVAAAVLLVNSLMPRRRRERTLGTAATADDRVGHRRERFGREEPATEPARPVERPGATRAD